MIALWLLSMVVLINAYIGTFTARMTVIKLEPTVDTLKDLAVSKTLYMTVERASNMKLKAMVEILKSHFYLIMYNSTINLGSRVRTI